MPIVVASSFADPKDVAAYKRAIAQGKTEAEALKVGDNGIGKWGDSTARDDVPMCALPPEDWLTKWGSGSNARGKKVAVTFKGKTVIGELRDTMPHKANIKNGAGIDLNPGFAKAFGVRPPFMLPGVKWEWSEQENAVATRRFVSYGDAIAAALEWLKARGVSTSMRLTSPGAGASECALRTALRDTALSLTLGVGPISTCGGIR